MNRSKVDFWAFRAKDDLQAIQKALGGVFAGSPQVPRLQYRKSGWKGYEACADVLLGDMAVGIVAHGGENQRGWAYVGITGRGCEWVKDWDLAQEAAEDCPEYQAKRIDLAVDTFSNDTGFEATLAAYRAGEFAPAGAGGRPPKCTTIMGERPEDGRTINVGNRERDKFFRGYEKGKQMLGPLITSAMQRDPESFDWGDWLTATVPSFEDGQLRAVSMWDWFRHELELKPKSAPLPDDIIERRDQYFAGAYPYLAKVLQGVEPEVLVMRRERGPQLDLSLALANVRRMFGDTLFTALVAHHGDIGAVWSRIVGKKHNQSLLRAGVLLVDHD